MALTQDQIDFFLLNGYLSYGRILDEIELATLRREYDIEFAKANQTGDYRNLAISDTNDLEKKKGAKQQMLQIMQMSERNIHFHKILFNSKILDIVEDLLGPNIQLFHDQALFKPAHTGGPVFWHQDNAYWKCRPANLMSCWLTLDDVNRENGAMQVIAGSHLRPIWHEKSETTDALLDLEKSGAVDPKKATVVDLPAGGCMFHHCQTLHYTQPNETPNQRRAFAIHFMTPGTKNTSHPNGFAASFANPILRMKV